MDFKEMIKIENVKIDIPLGIVTAVMNESNIKTCKTLSWNVKTKHDLDTALDTDEFSNVKLSTLIRGSNLTIEFDQLYLYQSDSNYACILYDHVLHSDSCETLEPVDRCLKLPSPSPSKCVTEDKAIQTEPVDPNLQGESLPKMINQPEDLPKKRKRGRPRLNKDVHGKGILNTGKTSEPNTNLEDGVHSQDPLAMKDDATSESFDTRDKKAGTSKVLNTLADDRPQILKGSVEINNLDSWSRRYGLRGVKLNKQMMNAVKGLDSSIAESENDITKQDIEAELSTNDSEYVREIEQEQDEISRESDSDDEKSRIKRMKNRFLKENFTSGDKLLANKRVRKKRKPGVLACKICNKLLCDYTGVYNHVIRRHSRRKNISEYLEELKRLKVVQCEICNIEFSDSLKFRQHMEIKHDKTEPVKCHECGKSFKNSQSWRSHIRAMHLSDQGKTNVCHLCPASFKTVSNLNQHIKQIHLQKKEFACKICSKRFFNKPLLKRHSRTHGLDESKRVFCEMCNKSFLFEFNLKRHKESVHVQQSDKFHCSYCGKGFGNKIGMITHVQNVHFNLFAYSCTECSASYPRSTMLRTHMISYHGKSEFELPELPSKNGVYDRTTENMFYCSYCGSAFKHKAKLVEHMHTDHADAFPHKCSICNQGFLEKSFLSVHNLRAHDVIEMDSESEPGQKNDNDGSGEILQFIATKAGCPSKVIGLQSEQNPSPRTSETENLETSANQTLETGTLLLEVADGSTTTQYVVEAPKGLVNESTVVQDISRLLLAAGQRLQIGDEDSGVHEISVVIEKPSNENQELGNTVMPDSTVITEAAGTLISSSELNTQRSQGNIVDLAEKAIVVGENDSDIGNVTHMHVDVGSVQEDIAVKAASGIMVNSANAGGNSDVCDFVENIEEVEQAEFKVETHN